MADNKKVYTLEIKGVKESYDALVKLNDVLEIMDDNFKKEISINKEISNSKKETKKTTDELSKAQEKLTNYDKDYQKELMRTKQELNEKNKAIKEEIAQEKIAEGSYMAKQMALSALGKTIKAYVANTEEQKSELKQMMANYASLNEELKNFDKTLGNHQREVGNYEIATRNLRGELMEMEQTLANMLASGVSRTDEAFLKLSKEAGVLKDAINDAKAEVNAFANDAKKIHDVVNVAKTLTSVYGLAQSTMAIFGTENEELTKSMQKLMAAMTALNSLEQLNKTFTDNSSASYKLLHKALQLFGIEKKKNIATITQDTAATVTNTTATTASTVATSASTVALKAFKVALASTGIGLIIVALGYLISNFGQIKEAIINVFPFLSELGDIFNNLKNVFMGVGKSIIDYVLMPFRTIGAVFSKLMKGDIKGAIKAGTDELKRGFNIIKNYKDGYDKQADKTNQKNLKKQRELLDKELKDKIDNLNAQYGADYKYTKEGQKLYKEYFSNKKKLYEKDTDEYKQAVNDELSFDREIKEKQIEEEKKIQAEKEKQIEENKNRLKKLQDDTNKILSETTKLYADNEQSRLDFQKKKIEELNAYTDEQLDYKINQLKEIHNKQNTLLQNQYQKELDDVKEQYDKLLKEAESLHQDTTILQKDYQDRITAMNDDFNQKKLDKEQDFNQKLIDMRNKRNFDLIKSSQDSMNKTNKLLDDQLKNIQALNTKPTMTGGFFDVINLTKTKEDINSAITQYQSLALSIKEESEKTEEEYNKHLSILATLYGHDSDEYSKLLDEKNKALNKFKSDLFITTKSISDLQKQESESTKDFWLSISKEIEEKFKTINETVLTPLYDAFSMLNSQQIEEAQKNLDEVIALHDKAVKEVTDSQNRINNLNEQLKNANGLRKNELEKTLMDEIKILKERESQEQILLANSEKQKEKVAEKERQQKKLTAAKQILEAIINTAVAVTGVLPNIPLAAVVGAMGAVSVATATANYNKLEEGGLIKGKSHKEGGIKIPNTNIEVEGNEFVVNKKSTEKYLPLLKAINNDKTPHSRNITYNTIYKQYADGGQLDYNLLSELVSNNNPIVKLDKPYQDNRPIVVSVIDINRGQERIAKIKDIVGL